MCCQFLKEVMKLQTLNSVIVRNDMIHWICTLITSLGFLNLAFKVVSLLSHTSVWNGRPSTRALTFGITNFLKYDNLLRVVSSVRYIFVSNWLQNLNQSKFLPSNLKVLLNPPTTDQPTTDYLSTDHRPTDPLM